jgi:hypothetical protein
MKKKRIAFGWSGTLVPEVGEFRCIAAHGPTALGYRPHLRYGALELMRALQREGWEIWLYTQGSLPKQRVALFFALHGVRLGGIITGKEHLGAYRRGNVPALNLKHPPAFGVSVIVDDKEPTQRAGQAYGFEAMLVSTRYDDWTAPIRQRYLAPTQESEPERFALAA